MEIKEIVQQALRWAADLYGNQFLKPLLEEVVRDGNWYVTFSFERPNADTLSTILGRTPNERVYKVIEVCSAPR